MATSEVELKEAVVAYLAALDADPETAAAGEMDERLAVLYRLTGTPDPLEAWFDPSI